MDYNVHSNPFIDDVGEPSNKSSQNLGFPFQATHPLPTENEGRSLATSSSPFRDDVFDVALGKTSHNTAETHDRSAEDKDRGYLASDNLATSTSSSSEGVVSISSSDKLATSSSPFSDSVVVPLDSSHTKTDNMTTTNDFVPFAEEEMVTLSSQNKDPQTSPYGSSPDSPFKDPFQRKIHDQTTSSSQECSTSPQWIMGLSSGENSPMPLLEEKKPLTTQDADSQTSPFSSLPDTPFIDPLRRGISDQTRTPGPHECSTSPKSTSTSPDGDSIVVPLKDTEINHLSTSKDSMPLVDERNAEPQTSPFSSSPDSPFKDPFRRGIHDQTQTPSPDECSTSPKSLSTSPYNDNIVSPLKNTETNHLSSMKDSMPSNNIPHLTMGLSFNRNCQTPQKTEAKASLFGSPTDTIPYQSPPLQVMEHPTMPTTPTTPTTPMTPKYRIPSHVFARDKSNANGDWSVASNDSLFSIQMGNSFTTDQFALRSGEFSCSSKPCTPVKSTSSGYNSPDFGLRESDLKTINEVSKSSEVQFHDKPRISQESTMSTKSFQFPILAEVDKCNSISMTGMAATATTPPVQQQTQSPTLTAPKPIEADVKAEAEVQPEEPNAPPPAEEQPKETTKWFTCFSCCSCLPARN